MTSSSAAKGVHIHKHEIVAFYWLPTGRKDVLRNVGFRPKILFAGREGRRMETLCVPHAKVEADPQRTASYWTFIAISLCLAEKMAGRSPSEGIAKSILKESFVTPLDRLR